MRWLLPVVGLLAATVPALADNIDGITLTVTHSSVPGEILLNWTGGLAPYSVYQSVLPSGLVNPANLLATTAGQSWPDSPPAGDVWYYEVAGGCDPATAPRFYPDADGDGFGDPLWSLIACALPPGYVTNGVDCDDGDAGINPVAADLPDALGVDSNCDAFDGDRDGGIYVSTTGVDAAGCGLTPPAPCRTCQYAINRALVTARPMLYVQEGTYPEPIALAGGIAIYGGYGPAWERPSASATTINGFNTYHDIHQFGAAAVSALDLPAPAHLADLTIVGPDAEAIFGGTDASSYGVLVVRSSVTLERVVIEAGRGDRGGNGAPGQDAPQLSSEPRMDGIAGGGAAETATCNDTSHGMGGRGGFNDCTYPSVGGDGGSGGTADLNCSQCPGILGCLAGNGVAGASGEQSDGTAGVGGTGGQGLDFCGPGLDGADGLVTNGSGGIGGPAGALMHSDAVLWGPRPGWAGGIGRSGGGGGGGGGAGGCDLTADSYGAGGGGGGAGGCSARTGGDGGGGGGASIGIYLFKSVLVASTCHIVMGSGGAGGNGGTGGQGQSGGHGAAGGAGIGEGQSGGGGGNGGHGGHSGGGGGGAGGSAIGIVVIPESSLQHDCTFVPGIPGPGGAGGLSAPLAPPSERDGNSGHAGAGGISADVLTCTAYTQYSCP